MVAILQTTPCDVSPAYIPVFWAAYEFGTTWGDVSPVIDVVVNINGSDFAILPMPPQEIGNAGNNEQTSFFFIDIQEVLQDWFDNTHTLQMPGNGNLWTSINSVAEIFIKIKSYLPTDGILYPEQDFVISQITHAINARRNQQEIQCLDDFTGFGCRFLTNKPNPTTVCKDESETLYFYRRTDIDLFWRIRTYDENHNIIQNGFIEMDAGNNQIHSLGVGPGNINNITNTINNIPIIINSDVSYYLVSVVIPVSDNTGDYFFDYTESRKFFYNSGCCPSHRFHFLNKFGVFDSVSILGDIKESYAIKGTYFESTMPLFIANDFDTGRGVNRLSSKKINRLSVSSYGHRKDFAIWLSELSNTVECFVEKSGKLIPVTVRDKNNDIYNSNEPLSEFNIVVQFSPETSQRN